MAVNLKATKREVFGKKLKGLRAEGLMPAELYGHNVPNLHLSLSTKEFIKIFAEAGESTVITLDVEGEKKPVLVQGVDYNHLKNEYRAVDFYQVKMDEITTAQVNIVLEGESPAVKSQDGVLVQVLNEVEVEALPADLPHEFVLDVSGLAEIGSSLHIKDIKVSDKVKIKEEAEAVIVTISAKQEEEEETGPTDVSEVEVEGEKEKKEDEEEKKEEDK